MAIIISKNGKDAKRIEKSEFEQEDYLQHYIYENPESIPLYDIREDTRLLVLCREFPTNSGPTDALGIDSEGNIYLVETKLYKNPDKRLVVAQVLDYGASLWKSNNFGNFISRIDQSLHKKSNPGLNQKIKEFFNLEDEEVDRILENVASNLSRGNFKFVVLMDKLHQQLKDLIIYLNQNSEFDIYAVELEYYKYESHEIIIPKIYGAEVKKDIQSATLKKKNWTWESFSQKLRDDFGDSAESAAKSILDFAEQKGIEIYWTTSQRGSFILGFASIDKMFYPFAIQGNGMIGWNAPHQGDMAPPPFNKPEKRKEILERIKAIKESRVDLNKVNGTSTLNLSLAALSNEEAKQEFFSILLWIKKTLEQN
jgi:hypothetical protein